MQSLKTRTTMEVTVEVITRSTVKVLVEVPDAVGPKSYGDIGKALFEATPAAMYQVVDRHFERMSFDKSDQPAAIVTTVDGEGVVRLEKCSDLVELALEETANLDEHGQLIFCVGSDDQKRSVITLPVSPDRVKSVVVKVTPFTEENKQAVQGLLLESLELEALPDGMTLAFEEFTQQELKYVPIGERHTWVVAQALVPRSEYVLSSWDEFSNFAYGIFAQDPCEMMREDVQTAVERFIADRAVTIHNAL